MSLWRPQLWTPFGDRCPDCNRRRRTRRFNPLRFAAGDKMLDASGNVILDASGNVQLSDGAGDNCCCGSADPCDCEDLSITCSKCGGFGACTPKYITITFSGITLCAGCVLLSTGAYEKVSGNPNQTYCLEQSTACTWRTLPLGTDTGVYAEGYGLDSTCTTLASTDNYEVLYQRFDVAGTERASIGFRFSGTGVFESTQDANNPTGCIENSPIANDITSSGDCGPFSGTLLNNAMGYGGTATIEACC